MDDNRMIYRQLVLRSNIQPSRGMFIALSVLYRKDLALAYIEQH